MTKILLFAAGFLLGGMVGMTVMALCCIAAEREKEIEDESQERLGL